MVNFDYLYNPDAAKDSLNQNYFLDKKLSFQVIENGMVLPHKNVKVLYHWGLGGVVDSNGKYIESSTLHPGVGGAYEPPKESIQYRHETAIYLGIFFRVWGHDLTDNIRRIWFLKSEFMNQFKNCPVVYIPYNEGYYTIENQPNFRRLLEILGVYVEDVAAITQPTKFDKIILPDGSFLAQGSGRGFTAEYRETIDIVRDFALKNRTPTSVKKVYLFYGRKRQVGEERLAEYFKSKGYEIIYPEKLTLDEQLDLMINCESFISTAGSCSHNSLFLRDGTETILIPRGASKFEYYQEILNQIHPLNINYIDTNLSIFCRSLSFGDFCFIISRQLKKFFGDKFDDYEDEDFKIFLQYVKNSSDRNLIINSSALTYYYDEVFPDFIARLKQRKDLVENYDLPTDWYKFRQPLTYQTHAHNKSWSSWINENKVSNELEYQRDLQAIKINFPDHKVYYSVYYSAEEGWSETVLSPAQAGTTGKFKAIMGIKIWLDETGTKEFDILYRVHKFDGQWTDWAKNGEAIYSQGQKLNAIQIKLEPKT